MPFFIPAFILAEELIQVVAVLGAAAVAVEAVEHAPRMNWPTHQTTTTSTTTTYVEQKTIGDWGTNGLAGQERDYLLQIGYSDTGCTYSLHELKRVAKYREKELLPEQSQVYIQQGIEENDYSSSEEERRGGRVVNCSKDRSPVGRGLKHHRGSIKTNGKSGDYKKFYSWDNTHNDIEVYNSRGEHLGSMDPRTGKMYKGPVAGRDIKHLL